MRFKQALVLASIVVLLLLGAAAARSEEAGPPPAPELKRTTLWLYGGWGPDGLTVTPKPGTLGEVEPFYGPLVGLGISSLVWEDRWSVSAQLLHGAAPSSNALTGVGGIGWSF